MARTKKTTQTTEEKKEEKKVLTRAEKNVGAQEIVKELLAVKPLKHNELIDEASKLYSERYGEEGDVDVHGVKGRIGSVVNNMEKESILMEDGGRYALKARIMPAPTPVEPAPSKEEKPVKKARKTTKKATETKSEETPVEEKPVKKTRKKATAEETKVETAEEKPAPKKRGRKPKAEQAEAQKEEVKTQEKPVEKAEAKEETPVEKTPEAKGELIVKEKGEIAKAPVVMDMSFLFGERKQKPVVAPQEKAPVKEEKSEKQAPVSATNEEKKAEKTETKQEKTPIKKEKTTPPQTKEKTAKPTVKKAVEKPMTADEKLCDAFLKKMRSLGGDYFEYYSVYLLERYSMKNGRRLEGLKITGGDHDGGIDGEIELTDKLGFRETIYIQSKNWNPEKGKEENWVVGETLLQQFIGACACKQAKDGKQHCRGIFVTTSRFTPEAKRILEDMSEKIVGYDGNDLYETAKECEFGIVKRNGEWALDEKLLSGSKAFFQM